MVPAVLIYLACVGGGITHVAYGFFCATLRGATGCSSAFAPFSSLQETGILLGFLLIFSLATFSMVNAYVSAAPKAQMLVSFGIGWGFWGLVSPFMS
ncbi:hypothetical protein ACIHCM_36510 [Streptomyces sp. NPDC052023]|uniref:hypothetical protein n=1 Tax=Streptomyces sp. NPDC052023 TaxID=3365681 RepID=UPI0037D85815